MPQPPVVPRDVRLAHEGVCNGPCAARERDERQRRATWRKERRMRAPGLPYFSTAGRFDVIDSSFDMLVLPYVSKPMTGATMRSSGLGGAGV